MGLTKGGTYKAYVEYSTPEPGTVFTIKLDDQQLMRKVLDATGGWHQYRKIDVGNVTLRPETHTLTASWETTLAEGAGNLRGIELVRQD